MDEYEKEVEIIKKKIANHADFPKPGVLYRDIFPVLGDPNTAGTLIKLILDYCAKNIGDLQAVAGVESRGFIFGPLISMHFHIPFVPIRKKGKLPGEVQSVSYNLEYGTDMLEIQNGALKKGTRVLIVDDLLATGGTLAAACSLIHSIGCEVIHCLVIIELEELKGRSQIKSHVHSIIKF